MIKWFKKQAWKVKVLFQGRKAIVAAMKDVHLAKDALDKSSWKSTEFWMAVMSAVAGVLAQASGLVPAPYGAAVAALSASIYSVTRGLAKKDDPLGGVKEGITTTELWATVLHGIAQAMMAIGGAVSPETALTLGAIANGFYAISRGLAKGGAQPQA